ncbi:MAG: class I SAM-dependent methyltransferase [Vicinamibacterales bacterium]
MRGWWPGSRPPRRQVVTLAPPDAYARWASSYPPEPHNPLMAAEQAAVMGLLDEGTVARFLDAGCGTGRYLRLLGGQAAYAVGVDASAPMLAMASGLGFPLVRGDLRGVPVGAATVDCAVCALALGDVPELGLAIAGLARTLRPGGRLVFSLVHERGQGEGWVRSFETPEGRWAVRTTWHTRADVLAACRDAGLAVDVVVEPPVSGSRAPALLVVRARQPRRTHVVG